MSESGNDKNSASRTNCVLIGTNFHSCGDGFVTQQYDRRRHAQSFPENVTLGFKSNFWRAFSSLSEHKTDQLIFSWLGRNWELHSLWVAESKDLEFSTYLDERTNYILVFLLKLLTDDDPSLVRQLHFEHGLNEQGAVEDLLNQIGENPFFAFLHNFRHKRGLNALFTWSSPEKTMLDAGISTTIAFFSFYSFAMLITWNIARKITYINLSESHGHFQENIQSVLRLRGRIINLDRYFSTKNIFNYNAVTKVSRDIANSFSLSEKKSDFLPMIEAMERHVLTAAQLRTDKHSQMLNVIAFVATAIGLPLSLMSMLLAFDPSVAPIIKDGVMIILSRRALLFFSSVCLAALCIALPLFAALHFFVREKRKRS
jgi:hypothetical protein